MERLQKIMAQAGVASRRHCEEMIRQGLVKVNGSVRKKLPIMADAQHDVILVAGRKLKCEHKVYFLLHKPKRVVCTNYDPDERRKTVDLLPGVRQRVYSVGRLDADSQGLVLMTNDGELANKITHPRYEKEKEYEVTIKTPLSKDEISQLEKGIILDGKKTAPTKIKQISFSNKNKAKIKETFTYSIILKEGRKRQIRKIGRAHV